LNVAFQKELYYWNG